MNKTLKLALVAVTILFAVPSYGRSRLLIQNFFVLIRKNYTKIRSDDIKQKRAEFDATNELIQLCAKTKINENHGYYPNNTKACSKAINYRKFIINYNKTHYKYNPILIFSGKFKGPMPIACIASVTYAFNEIRGKK